MCEMSERFNFILVSSVIDKSLFDKTKVKVVDTIEDALKIAYKDNNSLKVTVMPYAANTLPKLKTGLPQSGSFFISLINTSFAES
jgi:hypothetical protein